MQWLDVRHGLLLLEILSITWNKFHIQRQTIEYPLFMFCVYVLIIIYNIDPNVYSSFIIVVIWIKIMFYVRIFMFEQVCVEGNIASGKTSFLEHFKKNQNVEVSYCISFQVEGFWYILLYKTLDQIHCICRCCKPHFNWSTGN